MRITEDDKSATLIQRARFDATLYTDGEHVRAGGFQPRKSIGVRRGRTFVRYTLAICLMLRNRSYGLRCVVPLGETGALHN